MVHTSTSSRMFVDVCSSEEQCTGTAWYVTWVLLSPFLCPMSMPLQPQNGTNYYDGAAGVTECGIPPGEMLTYK